MNRQPTSHATPSGLGLGEPKSQWPTLARRGAGGSQGASAGAAQGRQWRTCASRGADAPSGPSNSTASTSPGSSGRSRRNPTPPAERFANRAGRPPNAGRIARRKTWLSSGRCRWWLRRSAGSGTAASRRGVEAPAGSSCSEKEARWGGVYRSRRNSSSPSSLTNSHPSSQYPSSACRTWTTLAKTTHAPPSASGNAMAMPVFGSNRRGNRTRTPLREMLVMEPAHRASARFHDEAAPQEPGKSQTSRSWVRVSSAGG